MSEFKQHEPCQFCRKVTEIALADTEDSTVYAYCEACGATSPAVDVGDYAEWDEHYDLHPQRQEIIDDTWNRRAPAAEQHSHAWQFSVAAYGNASGSCQCGEKLDVRMVGGSLVIDAPEWFRKAFNLTQHAEQQQQEPVGNELFNAFCSGYYVGMGGDAWYQDHDDDGGLKAGPLKSLKGWFKEHNYTHQQPQVQGECECDGIEWIPMHAKALQALGDYKVVRSALGRLSPAILEKLGCSEQEAKAIEYLWGMTENADYRAIFEQPRAAVPDEYTILAIFKRAGLDIEVGRTYSVRGQIAQLLNGARALAAVPDVKLQDTGAPRGEPNYWSLKVNREIVWQGHSGAEARRVEKAVRSALAAAPAQPGEGE